MRHRKRKKNLGRKSSHQRAMMRNLAKSLIRFELIQTTEAKAKMLRRFADKLITLGKRADALQQRDDLDDTQKKAQRLALYRRAESLLGGEKPLVDKIFNELALRPDLKDRQGGYTRIIKLANRQGDDALICRISFIGSTIENTTHLRFPEHIAEALEEDLEEYEEELDSEEDED